MYQLKLLSQMDTMDGLSFSTSDSRLEQKFLPYFAIFYNNTLRHTKRSAIKILEYK
jgi:hypothetical protein